MALQAWMLRQSCVLKPAGGADALRATLRPVLLSYFEAIDVSGDGLVDAMELEAAVAVLRQLGMARLLAELQARAPSISPLISPRSPLRSPPRDSFVRPRRAAGECLL